MIQTTEVLSQNDAVFVQNAVYPQPKRQLLFHVLIFDISHGCNCETDL